MMPNRIIWASVVAVSAVFGVYIAAVLWTSEPEPVLRNVNLYGAAVWTLAVERHMVRRTAP
jgi:hypothetical protein